MRNEEAGLIADLSCGSRDSSSARFCRPSDVNELLSSLNKGMKPVDMIPDRVSPLFGVVLASINAVQFSSVDA